MPPNGRSFQDLVLLTQRSLCSKRVHWWCSSIQCQRTTHHAITGSLASWLELVLASATFDTSFFRLLGYCLEYFLKFSWSLKTLVLRERFRGRIGSMSDALLMLLRWSLKGRWNGLKYLRYWQILPTC